MTKIYNYRSKKQQYFFLVTILIILLTGIFITTYYQPIGHIIYTIQAKDLISPIGDASPLQLTPTLIPLAKLSTKTTTLDRIVREQLNNVQGNYSIVFNNLTSHEKYVYNEHRNYQSASLYKLWVMAETFHLIHTSTLTENTWLTEDVRTLNKKFSIDDEYAELSEGNISFNVLDAINQMITISHNYAALLLTSKIRLSSVDTFLTSNSFIESKLGVSADNPTTTASDIALFFEKLYSNEFDDGLYADTMLGILKNQKLNEKIPKYLPSSVQVAHKTGEIYGFSHDAGIVFTPKGNYILVILSETEIPGRANEIIAKLSKRIYTYVQE